MNEIILAVIFSILPFTELRVGLPLAIDYALKNNVSILGVFLLILFLNILVIFFVFFFLDYLHNQFMKIKIYRKWFGYFLKKIQKRANKVEKRMRTLGFLALTAYVAIPLPVTGAYTGTLIAWILGLDRKKSIIAISVGVCIAGIIILVASLGGLSILRPYLFFLAKPYKSFMSE